MDHFSPIIEMVFGLQIKQMYKKPVNAGFFFQFHTSNVFSE